MYICFSSSLNSSSAAIALSPKPGASPSIL
jgi:hypothetical protein